MSDSHCAWADRQLNIIIKMIFGLTSMIGFFKVHVSIFRDDTISNSNVGLHWSKWILLLHEVDSDVALPVVGACFIEDVEVSLLA
jgi:hypothetical protein